MDSDREMDEFRRIELVAEFDRINGLLANYRQNSDDYRRRLGYLNQMIGRIGALLGEPEPEEPRWH